MLSADEREQLKAVAAADLRTPGNVVTAFVIAALAKKGPVRVQVAPAERSKFDVNLQTCVSRRTQQWRELRQRAKADERLLANYVTAVVVSNLGKGCRARNYRLLLLPAWGLHPTLPFTVGRSFSCSSKRAVWRNRSMSFSRGQAGSRGGSAEKFFHGSGTKVSSGVNCR
jgi:hypothetical protein